jgi:hypothetical protein
MDLGLRTSLVVGILSDTHVPYRMKQLPPAVFRALDDVDVILHAGDVDKPATLKPLEAIAPVHAVRGNVHLQDLSSGGASLPASVELCLAGHRVLLTHGYLPGLPGLWFKGRDVIFRALGRDEKSRFNRRTARHLTARYPRADVIVFGHTHRAYVTWVEETLVVNPGAVCPTRGERPTVVRMALDGGESCVEIVPLDVDLGQGREC